MIILPDAIFRLVLMTLLAGLGLCVFAAAAKASLGRSEEVALLWAISQIESGGRTGAIGRDGEFTAYQFKLSTWQAYTRQSPAAAAKRPALADEVAARHLSWLRERLKKAGLPVTPYALALAWNAGARTVIEGRTLPRHRDYAERVVALMEGKI